MNYKTMLTTAILAMTPTLGGCGWLVGELVEDMHRTKAVKAYVYEDDIDELWEEVHELAEEYDCEIPKDPEVDETFPCETEPRRWVRVDKVSSGHKVRIDVEEIRTEEGRQLTDRSRDIELEWKLLERLHPADAQAIETEAEKRGARAKKATRKLDENLDET